MASTDVASRHWCSRGGFDDSGSEPLRLSAPAPGPRHGQDHNVDALGQDRSPQRACSYRASEPRRSQEKPVGSRHRTLGGGLTPSDFTPVSAIDGGRLARGALGLLAMTSWGRAKTGSVSAATDGDSLRGRFPVRADRRGYAETAVPATAPTMPGTRAASAFADRDPPEAAMTQSAPRPCRPAKTVDLEAATTACLPTKRRRRPSVLLPLDKAGNVGDPRRAFRRRGIRVR